ncbi:MAG: cytochrome c3 family protein [Coriobacteriia bacterium]|nr:cytochrome c3 family protein [Coriobacteriia bacterium]
MAETDKMPPDDMGAPAEPLESGEPQAPAHKRRRFPWKSAIALLVILVLVLPVYFTLQPSYYDRYPQLHSRIDAWRKSTHARISCAQCHVDPGPVGFLTFAAKSIPAFYSQLIFGPSDENLLSVPDTAACQKCHTDYREVSPAGDLLIPHRAHVEVLKIKCAVCHKNLVHSLNAAGFNKPEMQTCLSLCHNGVKATNQCNKCHTRKQVPPSHLAKDWLTVHPTMVGKIDCAKCHAWAPNYCRECHSHRPPSHVGNWKQLHGARAKAIGTKGCLFCHGAEFCAKCH